MGIRLHKKHGLNPTISICFICGKPKKEVALLGSAYKGRAPMHMVTSLEPCEKCKKMLRGGGVAMVGARPTPDQIRNKMIKPRTIPILSGDAIIIKEKAFKRLLKTPVPKGRIVFAEPLIIRKIQSLTRKKLRKKKKR